jgi:hypothetical protein
VQEALTNRKRSSTALRWIGIALAVFLLLSVGGAVGFFARGFSDKLLAEAISTPNTKESTSKPIPDEKRNHPDPETQEGKPGKVHEKAPDSISSADPSASATNRPMGTNAPPAPVPVNIPPLITVPAAPIAAPALPAPPSIAVAPPTSVGNSAATTPNVENPQQTGNPDSSKVSGAWFIPEGPSPLEAIADTNFQGEFKADISKAFCLKEFPNRTAPIVIDIKVLGAQSLRTKPDSTNRWLVVSKNGSGLNLAEIFEESHGNGTRLCFKWSRSIGNAGIPLLYGALEVKVSDTQPCIVHLGKPRNEESLRIGSTLTADRTVTHRLFDSPGEVFDVEVVTISSFPIASDLAKWQEQGSAPSSDRLLRCSGNNKLFSRVMLLPASNGQAKRLRAGFCLAGTKAGDIEPLAEKRLDDLKRRLQRFETDFTIPLDKATKKLKELRDKMSHAKPEDIHKLMAALAAAESERNAAQFNMDHSQNEYPDVYSPEQQLLIREMEKVQTGNLKPVMKVKISRVLAYEGGQIVIPLVVLDQEPTKEM